MLLRQALEQTRAGKPIPVLFNTRRVVLDSIDEASAMVRKGVFDVRFYTVHHRATTGPFLRGPAGQVWQRQ